MLRDAFNMGSVGKLRQLETNCGRTFEPDSLIAREALRPHIKPSECITYDPQHVIFQHGWVACEIADSWKAPEQRIKLLMHH